MSQQDGVEQGQSGASQRTASPPALVLPGSSTEASAGASRAQPVGVLQAASVFARLAAWFVDVLLVFGVLYIGMDLGGTALTVSILFSIGYFPVVTAATSTTLGKRLLGMRVVDMHTFGRLPVGRAVGREIRFNISAVFLYLPCLTLLGNSQRQAWYDRAVDSLVVRG